MQDEINIKLLISNMNHITSSWSVYTAQWPTSQINGNEPMRSVME